MGLSLACNPRHRLILQLQQVIRGNSVEMQNLKSMRSQDTGYCHSFSLPQTIGKQIQTNIPQYTPGTLIPKQRALEQEQVMCMGKSGLADIHIILWTSQGCSH